MSSEPPPAGESTPAPTEASEAYGERPDPFRPDRRPPLLQRAVPVAAALSRYRAAGVRRDVLAGVTVAAVALPAGMAYAEVAGLSPVVGLYALLLPTIAYALLGSSRQLVVGPDGATSVLVATALAPMAVADPGRYAALAAMLALMVGAVFVVARLARLGWMADYFSHPVLVGYIHGIAIVLIVGQLEKLLGFDVDGDRVLDQLSDISRNLEATDAATVAVGVGSLVVLVGLRLVARRVPAALIVVVGGIIVSAAVGLEADGVPVVGDVPSGLPSFEVPRVGVAEFAELIPAALGIFFVSFADAILTARSFAGRHGQRIDVRQEMGALGAANLASGLTQGYAVSSSSSRTAVNDQMGARTQVAGAVAAVVIAVVLLVLTAPVAYLPTACLGAVIIVAAAGLVSPAAWRTLARVDRVEVGIAATTTATVILVGVLQALVIAVALSILDVVRRSARPRDAVLGYVDGLGRWADVRFNPSARLTPGVVVYRLDDRLFFANASYFKGRIRESVAAAPPPVHSLVFDAESMNLVDSSGLSALADVVSQLRAEGIAFSVARMHGPVMADLERDGLVDVIGRANFHPTVAAAVAACVTPPAAPPGP